MQAIILAAGMGKRLKKLTENNTKCMIKVNGVTLIERLLRQLEKQNLSRIIIVVGYEGQKLIDYIATLKIQTSIKFVDNPDYSKTNNIYSLFLAKDYLCAEDTLLFESDLIFEDSILDSLIKDPRDTLAVVDKYESWMDGTCLKIDSNDNIEKFIPGKKINFSKVSSYYKTVNIYKFSKYFSETHYVPFLDAYTKALGNNEYYEQVLRIITLLDVPVIKAKRLNGELWYEIDDIQDLDIATSMFAPDVETKASLMHKRYGGYWRYPNLLDFCYLVNPYYPPVKLKEELKASFDKLLTQYPSGIRVNSLLAAKTFGINTDNIVIGNGAAELIKSFMSILNCTIGFIKPTFEEYPNRYSMEKSLYYTPESDGFRYSCTDITAFFENTGIGALVIINPDNPSGNYISYKDMIYLIEWCEKRSIKIIIDESFLDFSDEEDGTLLTQDTIEAYSNLYVIKSISKSFGVPGLRLGVLASSDIEMIDFVKKDISIWNINSFGEFYMQICEKYQSEYKSSLILLRNERKRLFDELNKLSFLKVFPSQANFLMIELVGKYTAKELTEILLSQYNILIKDLSGKANGRQLIRIAIRGESDNDYLVSCLQKIYYA